MTTTTFPNGAVFLGASFLPHYAPLREGANYVERIKALIDLAKAETSDEAPARIAIRKLWHTQTTNMTIAEAEAYFADLAGFDYIPDLGEDRTPTYPKGAVLVGTMSEKDVLARSGGRRFWPLGREAYRARLEPLQPLHPTVGAAIMKAIYESVVETPVEDGEETPAKVQRETESEFSAIIVTDFNLLDGFVRVGEELERIEGEIRADMTSDTDPARGRMFACYAESNKGRLLAIQAARFASTHAALKELGAFAFMELDLKGRADNAQAGVLRFADLHLDPLALPLSRRTAMNAADRASQRDAIQGAAIEVGRTLMATAHHDGQENGETYKLLRFAADYHVAF